MPPRRPKPVNLPGRLPALRVTAETEERARRNALLAKVPVTTYLRRIIEAATGTRGK